MASTTEPAAGSNAAAALAQLRSLVTSHPNWPAPNVTFRDIFPIFRSPSATALLFDTFTAHLASLPPIDAIVGLESRGFLIGAAIAPRLGAAFVPVRKVGKLPGPAASVGYAKEYGADAMEIQHESILPGQSVVIVDDLLATGGSLHSAIALVEQLGGRVMECAVLIELVELQGRSKLSAPVHAFLSFAESD